MKKVAWVIPSFIEGSGGYRTIFQHINFMSQKYSCDVYVYDSGDFRNEAQLEKKACALYGGCNCKFYLGFPIREDIRYDFVIATAWMTAETVKKYKGDAKKVYFVQDYEPFFYSVGNLYLEALNTYNLGFYHITIGKWLSWKLSHDHNAKTKYFDFCIDRKIYYPLNDVVKEKAICFIYQPEKPRRASELGVQALYLVKQIMPEVTIYLYGSPETKILGLDCVNKGIITVSECNYLYNCCQVGLCISATNPSRIPFEMLASGIPVVDIYRENNLFDCPNEGVLLAQSRPESIAQAILDILQNVELQQELSIKGLKFMEDRTLDFGMQQFMDILDSIENFEEVELSAIEKQYKKVAIEASNELMQMGERLSSGYYRKRSCLEKIKKVKWIRKIPGIKRLRRVFENV